MGNTSSSNQDQNGKGPTEENKEAAQYQEQPSKKCRRLISAMSEYLWSEDEDQPKDHVNDGNASKQSRYCTLDVIENGQEPQMFIVENLLWIWRSCIHNEEISKTRSKGLAQNQPPSPQHPKKLDWAQIQARFGFGERKGKERVEGIGARWTD
jgi:hypothetical protein